MSKGKEVEANIPHGENVAESSRKNVMFATPASTVLVRAISVFTFFPHCIQVEKRNSKGKIFCEFLTELAASF